MRFRYALLERRTRVAATSVGNRQVALWFIGADMATGLDSDDKLEQALEYARGEGWQVVPEEIAVDAALLKRPR